VTVRTGAEVPVAGADVSASDTRVAGAGEELTLTDGEGDGETTAFTVVVELCVGDVELDDPEPPDDGDVGTGADADTSGAEADPDEVEADPAAVWADTAGVEVFVLGETEFETGVVGEALTEAGACPDVVVGACTDTDAAPAAPAPDIATAAASATAILLPAPIIRNASNIRPSRSPHGYPSRAVFIQRRPRALPRTGHAPSTPPAGRV
jgi:hypothetical protein